MTIKTGLTIYQNCGIIKYQMIPRCRMANINETYRIESREDVRAYLAKLKYAIDGGARLVIQEERQVDKNRPEMYTNKFTIPDLFPDEDPQAAIKRELKTLTIEEYIKTVKDLRFPKKSEMREFGKVYKGNKEVYIKLRVEVLGAVGQPPLFVMSFHYAMKPFSEETFPYCKS